MPEYPITAQELGGTTGFFYAGMTVQKIGVVPDTTPVVYVFYQDLNDWDTFIGSLVKLSYKYSTDAFAAQRHLTVNIGGTDEDIMWTSINICQGSTGFYIFGKAKHGGVWYNTYTKIDSTGIDSRAVLESTDPLEGLVGPYVFELPSDKIFSNVSLIDWAGLAVLSTPTYPTPLGGVMCIKDNFLNPMEDENYIFFEFFGTADTYSVTSKLKYYFLAFDKLLERYAYLPFQIDFTPDVPANNYERRRIMAMCPDWQGRMMMALCTFTYKSWLDTSPPDQFPNESSWQFVEFAANYTWVVGYSDRSIYSRMQTCDAMEFANTEIGKVFAGSLQKDVSIAFWITQLTKANPFTPLLSTETVKTGLANYALSNTGLFGGTSNWYGNCQWICTNRLPLDCTVIMATSTFNGCNNPGDALCLYTLTLHTLNLGGLPPKPISLTSKTFWDEYGFRLYAGYSGAFDTVAKEVKFYLAGAPVSTRIITDASKYIDVLVGDGLTFGNTFDYSVRYQDSCLNWGSWSDWEQIDVREFVGVSNLTVGVAQFPTVSFRVTPYESLITNIRIDVYDGANLITSLSVDDVYNYIVNQTTTYIDFSFIIDPIKLAEMLKEQLYTFKTYVTNEYNRVTNTNINQTLNYTEPADVTALTCTVKTGYFQLDWTGGYAVIFRNGLRIGFGTNIYIDYDAPLNLINNYKVYARDADANGLNGTSVSGSITEHGYALVSENFAAYTSMPEKTYPNENSNVKYERIGDDIFLDYTQEAGGLQLYFTRDDKNLLMANYFNKQFYFKYGNKVVLIVITSLNTIFSKDADMVLCSINYERVEL